jgi:hypothetical protein
MFASLLHHNIPSAQLLRGELSRPLLLLGVRSMATRDYMIGQLWPLLLSNHSCVQYTIMGYHLFLVELRQLFFPLVL